jgi:thioredoxin reductase (NADPH)
MSHYLIQQIEQTANIQVRCGTVVEAAHGSGHLQQLMMRDTQTGNSELVDAQWLFVFIGAAPRTDWLGDTVLRDKRGFILAGPDLTPDGRPPADWGLDRPPYHLETSIPGVFVAGDARAESAKRVASAVGEGAMAVMLVHRYLEQS